MIKQNVKTVKDENIENILDISNTTPRSVHKTNMNIPIVISNLEDEYFTPVTRDLPRSRSQNVFISDVIDETEYLDGSITSKKSSSSVRGSSASLRNSDTLVPHFDDNVSQTPIEQLKDASNNTKYEYLVIEEAEDMSPILISSNPISKNKQKLDVHTAEELQTQSTVSESDNVNISNLPTKDALEINELEEFSPVHIEPKRKHYSDSKDSFSMPDNPKPSNVSAVQDVVSIDDLEDPSAADQPSTITKQVGKPGVSSVSNMKLEEPTYSSKLDNKFVTSLSNLNDPREVASALDEKKNNQNRSKYSVYDITLVEDIIDFVEPVSTELPKRVKEPISKTNMKESRQKPSVEFTNIEEIEREGNNQRISAGTNAVKILDFSIDKELNSCTEITQIEHFSSEELDLINNSQPKKSSRSIIQKQLDIPIIEKVPTNKNTEVVEFIPIEDFTEPPQLSKPTSEQESKSKIRGKSSKKEGNDSVTQQATVQISLDEGSSTIKQPLESITTRSGYLVTVQYSKATVVPHDLQKTDIFMGSFRVELLQAILGVGASLLYCIENIEKK
ncbi:hypothetical protein HK103_000218 [Boothiomyces macroporosus]|uniref:Uncharacterized protein n=1 Tax=Boothiomyces macroporosus TaxID=261099 RepID=A0AAD5YA97_9FUNG|nr:hypothetical protein HK103_000218 [Boothiomyces macroporosus]